MLDNSKLEEKRKKALSIPIRCLLANEHIFPTKEGGTWYRSPFRDDKTASFRIYPEKNTWIDFGLQGQHNGGDVINLISRLKGLNFIQSIDYILRMDGIVYTDSISSPELKIDESDKSSKHSIVSITHIKHPGLIRYLGSRHIPIDIANRYCKEIHYTFLPTGRHFFGIGFGNDAGGWVIRTAPYPTEPKGKKMDIIASGITTIRINAQQIDKTAYVFEGFLNFLSFVSLYGAPKHDVYVLNSALNAGALCGIANTGVRELYFFRDNDDRGLAAYDEIKDCSGCIVIDASTPYRTLGLDDLNDYIIYLAHNTKKCV